jgi:hypothetical protein
MDVMLGTVADDHFVLEPGALERRASIKSVAAHSLYERENPYTHAGPGHQLDLSKAKFEEISDRQVRVEGARIQNTGEFYVKLEGARKIGYRTICIAGVRCPTMVANIGTLLETAREKTLSYFAPEPVRITFHVHGRDGVMQKLEPKTSTQSHELGIVMDVVAPSQELAHAACHHLSGTLLHMHYPGIFNTSGNLAFLYSPSELDAGAVYEFSIYHLMKAASPTELFPVHMEKI